MKNLHPIVLLSLMLLPLFGQAQRYQDVIFTDVDSTADVVYGNNIDIYPIILGLSTVPVPSDLKMDIYEPAGDTASNRPVVVLIHTGTYFDPVLNGSPAGLRTDSVIVELAHRFAKRGYVVASIDHRRGWNPTGDAETKRKTILEATYRAIQDARTAVRYFRKSHAEDGNPHGIDPDNIIMGGDGTGGYITYAATFLKRIDQVLITKFFDFSQSPAVPYVDTLQLGDPYGIVAGTLNTPNWPTYSSEFNMGFAIGGALGDSSWVEAGDPPFAALQTTEDRLAPYFVDDVIEPVNFDVVIAQAAGAYSTLEKVNEKGLNQVWVDAGFNDPISMEAASKNDGLEGLFPFQMEFTSCMSQCVSSIPNYPMDTCAYDGAPWQWYNETWYEAAWDNFPGGAPAPWTGAEEICQTNLGAPNDAARARTYIDTIEAFLAPRMFAVLDLDVTSIEDVQLAQDLSIYPNPAQDRVFIQQENASNPIQQVRLLDLSGKTVQLVQNLNDLEVRLDRHNLPAGVYLLEVTAKEGRHQSKLMLQ